MPPGSRGVTRREAVVIGALGVGLALTLAGQVVWPVTLAEAAEPLRWPTTRGGAVRFAGMVCYAVAAVVLVWPARRR